MNTTDLLVQADVHGRSTSDCLCAQTTTTATTIVIEQISNYHQNHCSVLSNSNNNSYNSIYDDILMAIAIARVHHLVQLLVSAAKVLGDHRLLDQGHQ